MRNEAEFLKSIIEYAEKEDVLYSNNEILTGYSSIALISLLQHLASNLTSNECYVEVGVFQGLSLLGVSKVVQENGIKTYGIDNFSQFDSDNKNYSLVQERAKLLELDNFKIIDKDFEEALLNLIDYIGTQKVGLYFIDGPHDYRSQLLCLEMAKNALSDNAVIVIDDCNYLHVRQATYDFLILNPDYKLVFQSYHPHHPHQKNKQHGKWWNGVHVITKSKSISTLLPPIDKSRKIFFEDHIYMTSKYPMVAYESGMFAASIRPFRPLMFIKRFFKLISAVRNQKDNKNFDNLNTYSNLSDYPKRSPELQ